MFARVQFQKSFGSFQVLYTTQVEATVGNSTCPEDVTDDRSAYGLATLMLFAGFLGESTEQNAKQ